MNERIKLLAEQAGFSGEGFHNTMVGTCQETALTYFAESIVRECIAQVRKDENGPAYEAAGRIAEHFGIE